MKELKETISEIKNMLLKPIQHAETRSDQKKQRQSTSNNEPLGVKIRSERMQGQGCQKMPRKRFE